MRRDITVKIADITRLYTRERDYWHKRLAGEPGKSVFPYDRKPGGRQTGDEPASMAAESFRVKGEIHSRLLALSTDSEPTLHVILTAVLVVLLGKYTGNTEIILGVPVYKQEQEADFINTALALRNVITPGMTFKELLLQVKETLLEAHDHQNYPLERLAAELYPESLNPDEGNPLFDVALLLENIHDPEYIRYIRHNMTFCLFNSETFLEGRVEYNTLCYRERTVNQIIDHFQSILSQVVFNLDMPLARVEILSATEKKTLLEEFNETENPIPGDKSLHRLIEEQVEKTPTGNAVIETRTGREKSGQEGQETSMPDGKSEPGSMMSITYRELNERAHDLALRLQGSGVRPDTIVGIMMERSIDLVVGILGILKAGGAYMPIDPRQPEDRTKYMMADSGAKILLTAERISTIPYTPHRSYMSYTPGNRTLAYVIYTSGTTGRPKGVMLEHRGVVNYITWAAQTYLGKEALSLPLYTSIAFDLTVTSIFTPLITGNSVIVYNGAEGEILLDKIIADNRVGVVKLTPAHLRLLKEMGNTVDYTGTRIKRFILGGENLETRLAHDIHNLWQGNIEIYNEYGPTETVVGSMIHRYDPGRDRMDSVSLGKPIANTCIYILDRDMNPVPVGVTGEIYIGGTGVGRGYLNRPELTSEKFIDLKRSYMSHKSSISYSHYISYPVYRTGDLARRHEDGAVEFLGRSDHQVKIRGHRIELGEIENRLKQFKQKEHTETILAQPPVDTEKVRNVKRCTRCLLSAQYPGIDFDNRGVCNVCREYDDYEIHVKNYFKTPRELEAVLKQSSRPGTQYDCLLLFSGGKDSTYVLYRLIDMGLKVLTFTFDNGYISESAFENIRRTTSALQVDHITGRAEHTNRVFVESLGTNNSVCHGCWNAVNAYGVKLAHEKGISRVISGLSRGQIFEMRLHGLFHAGIFNENEIEEKLLTFRKGFHSRENKFARILDMVLAEEVVESIQFLDFFRYDDTKVEKIKEYLYGKGWVQPQDTGFCSSNCLINDVGIYMHLKAQGIHFYEAPLSWDVRLGQITRETGLAELGFTPEPRHVDRILREIGYYNQAVVKDVVVLDRTDKNGNKYLCAYIVSDREITAREIREHLAAELPEYMIPAQFIQVEQIPLSTGGKVERKALIALEEKRRLGSAVAYIPPGDEKEILMATILKQLLNQERVGIDDNFFELGATSFEVIQLNHRLSQELGQEIPVIKFFEYPTIASILGYLRGEGISRQEQIAEIKRDEAMERGKNRYDLRRKMRG